MALAMEESKRMAMQEEFKNSPPKILEGGKKKKKAGAQVVCNPKDDSAELEKEFYVKESGQSQK